MNLLPFHSETLVSALSKAEVLEQLNKQTREVDFLDKRSQYDQAVLFNGMVGKHGFRISKVVQKGDSFLPLILGKVEDTARGSILFLQYRLFPGALFFIVFWSIVLLAFSAFYFAVLQNFLFGGICLAVAIVNYLLAIFFFRRQVKISRNAFHQLINLQMKD
ncbi:hypothetical protein [Algoriphagus sp. CAU 1675]|uniref:hypothetical protein n=1 Tax=Algoriphagus sp. CAU 1675 TaxID=3032597 RepID=UPI0023DC4142|nr:hypothetical protein [Algoriphagus sp. CAU 1675]MDF2156687.1 hypothetical protein [Algoriphagus sp. CAU 1675]